MYFLDDLAEVVLVLDPPPFLEPVAFLGEDLYALRTCVCVCVCVCVRSLLTLLEVLPEKPYIPP